MWEGTEFSRDPGTTLYIYIDFYYESKIDLQQGHILTVSGKVNHNKILIIYTVARHMKNKEVTIF